MISIYTGTFFYCIGVAMIMSLAAKEVPDSSNMPTGLKIGLFFFSIGGVLFCAGSLYMLLTAPMTLFGFQV